jgi:hypothetical protein
MKWVKGIAHKVVIRSIFCPCTNMASSLLEMAFIRHLCSMSTFTHTASYLLPMYRLNQDMPRTATSKEPKTRRKLFSTLKAKVATQPLAHQQYTNKYIHPLEQMKGLLFIMSLMPPSPRHDSRDVKFTFILSLTCPIF